MPQSYISKWERDEQAPEFQNAVKLSVATGKPASYFADATTPLGPSERPAIDDVATRLSGDDWQLVYDFAVSLLSPKAKRRTGGPSSAATAKGKRRRGPSSGSAPAA